MGVEWGWVSSRVLRDYRVVIYMRGLKYIWGKSIDNEVAVFMRTVLVPAIWEDLYSPSIAIGKPTPQTIVYIASTHVQQSQ